MKLIPLGNHFIFTFVDHVNANGQFEKQTTESGIILKASFDDSAKSPRWVNVIAAGPLCEQVQVGAQVLLPNLRWTSNVKMDNKMMWQSDESQVVAIRKNASDEIAPLDNVVLFTRLKNPPVQTVGLLFVVGQPNSNTPTGSVTSMGPKVDSLSVGCTIYFDDTNFTDTFDYKGQELSFIRDENILAYS